jgi:hypothetical protein
VKNIIHRFKVRLLWYVGVAALIPLFVSTGVAQAASWSVIPSPNPGVSGNELNAVAVVASKDVWAVGDITVGNGASQTLIEHWDGTMWNVVSSPSPSPFHNVLNGVTAVSANDVWAAGWLANARDVPQTLIEHWNGTTWSVVASPNAGKSTNVLNAVKAASATDVWAVGQFSNASGFRQTLTEHWNGKKWKIVSSPNVGTHDNILHGVTTVSSTDAWAVGDSLDMNSNAQALIEHWDGTMWSVVSSPGSGASTLNAVRAVSSTDVWAVGGAAPSQTLTEHWDGKQWSIVASPSPGTNDSELRGVAIISARNIWAVGFALNNGLTQTLIEHWNGKKWSVVASPSPSSTLNFLNGADADPHSGQTWAVGVFFNASGLTQTLTEFHP